MFFIVRDMWDTGYEDHTYTLLEDALKAKKELVRSIAKEYGIPRDTAKEHVKIFAATEVG